MTIRLTSVRRALLLFLAGVLLWWAGHNEAPAAAPVQWYKGNLHTHTLNSDGDSSPLEVATWYRENGYRFLVLSDHNFLTEVDRFNPIIGATEKFLLIQGEEVTARFADKHVHVNAIDLRKLLLPEQGATLVETIQKNVDVIRNAGAIPSVNHPNFHWSMTSRDLIQVENLTHFEVYNGHPGVNNNGGGDAESLDQMWDAILTAGRRVYGVAVDDAHHFKKFGPTYSNPGKGWVMVRAERLETAQIAAALRAGDFYASTGVVLENVERSTKGLSLRIAQTGDHKFTTYFLGARGEVLARSGSLEARYEFRGGESYVRARVEASNGAIAWTQPAWRN
jgi:predicted metal-dependent phosphoesterase TrpH